MQTDALEQAAGKVLSQIVKHGDSMAPEQARNLAVAYGVLIDKWLLLRDVEKNP